MEDGHVLLSMGMFCLALCDDIDVKIHDRLINSWANDGVSTYKYYFCIALRQTCSLPIDISATQG